MIATERDPHAMTPPPAEETRRLVQRIVDLPTLPIVVPQVLRKVGVLHGAEEGRMHSHEEDGHVEQRRVARLEDRADEGLRRGLAAEHGVDPDPVGQRERQRFGRVGLRRSGLQLREQRLQGDPARVVY